MDANASAEQCDELASPHGCLASFSRIAAPHCVAWAERSRLLAEVWPICQSEHLTLETADLRHGQSSFSPSDLTTGAQSATSAARASRNFSGFESRMGSKPPSNNDC